MSIPSDSRLDEALSEIEAAEGSVASILRDLYQGNEVGLIDDRISASGGTSQEALKLLYLLQDNPIPEVVDPMNLQSGGSDKYAEDGSDYSIYNPDGGTLIDDFEDNDTTPADPDFSSWTDNGEGTFEITSSDPIKGNYSARFRSGTNAAAVVSTTRNSHTSDDLGIIWELVLSGGYSSDTIDFTIYSGGSKIVEYVVTEGASADTLNGTSVGGYAEGEVIEWDFRFDFANDEVTLQQGYSTTGTTVGLLNTASGWDKIEWTLDTTRNSDLGYEIYFDDVYLGGLSALTSYVTDRFDAPTTAPADFKAWNAIRAQGVTTGGSTSTNPVEFDLLDSSDTTLNSARIPASEIADSTFDITGRIFSEDAGVDNQSNFVIPERGAGGHYGIPILSVVTVSKNGALVDTSDWEFDGTDTVTIDTSSESISSGDTIEIEYDLDIFDSTLQPRANLSRESASETSPSISHFKYWYIV